MDAVIVIDGRNATCRKLRDVRKGDAVVCSVNGIRVIPEFQERDRHGFAFMTGGSRQSAGSEVGVSTHRLQMMQERRPLADASRWSPDPWWCIPAVAPTSRI